MKSYILNFIDKIASFSKKLDDLATLTNKKWLLFDVESGSKTVFIFESDNSLIISINGKAEIGSWKYISSECILVSYSEGMFLFNHAFVKDDILIFNLDGTEKHVVFLNEIKLFDKIRSIESLRKFLLSIKPIDSPDHPYGTSYYKINPLTLKNEGFFNLEKLIELDKRNKINRSDKFISLKDKKSYTLSEILNPY